jgi:PIN domain nuclease of toxin-antitoxin system
VKKYLLDTHVFLWWLADDPSLGKKARAIISDEVNMVYVSAASVWEISIKKKLGKLKAPPHMEKIVEEEQFMKLPILFSHAEKAGQLPFHHHDPFDRMLIAQALTEGLTIVTSDRVFSGYKVKVLPAEK